MTSYCLVWRGAFKDPAVTTHPTVEVARGYLALPKFAAGEFDGLAIDKAEDIDLSGPGLVALYNALAPISGPVNKFESRSRGKERVFALIEDEYLYKPHADFSPAAEVESPASPADETQAPANAGEEAASPITEGGEDVATKKKARKSRAKTTTAERKHRGTGNAAGKVADFRQVREGTDRQKVLKLMNGQHTAEQIAQELGWGEAGAKKVGQVAFCLSRDCAIGYEFSESGKIKAVYPGEKTYRDAVKKAKED